MIVTMVIYLYIFYHGNSVVMAIILFGNLPFKIIIGIM